MKPTCRAIVNELQRAHGEWVNLADLDRVGGERYGGRVADLRALGFVIEQKGTGRNSCYRLVSEPTATYARFSCLCGFGGPEPVFTHEPTRLSCPGCGRTVAGQERLAG